MKRIATLFFAFIMLLSLAACGEKATNTDTHTHSYTLEVTAEATCNTEGTKTFSCSCGDTYTEAIPLQHMWSDWQVETYAMIGKPGTEKRTCSACSASESQARTANAIANSFYDAGLVFFGTNDTCKLTGPGLLSYAVSEFPEYRDTPVKTSTIFEKLSERFNIPDQLIADAKYWGQIVGRYNEADDTFIVQHDSSVVEMGKLKLLGYVHKGENRYAVYYECNNGVENRYCEFELEYNRLDGKPNKYLSSGIASTLPDDIVKCSEGEQSEFVG